MPLIKHLATNDALGLKLGLRENFYKKADNPADLGILVFRTGTTFQEIANEIGTKRTVFLVALMLHNFCSQYNLGPGKNMTLPQIVDIATDLTTGFIDRKGNAVRLEEMAIFFDKAGKGEYKRKNGQPFIFDRIDRQVIEEMLDRYFETDRTAAVWKLEDIQNNRHKETAKEDDTKQLPRMVSEDNAETVGDYYTRYAGMPGKISLLKLGEKYLGNETGNNDAGPIPGEDITAGKQG